MTAFKVNGKTPSQVLVNCLYNSLHYPSRKGYVVKGDAHYKEVTPGKYIRLPWATEIELIVNSYKRTGSMPYTSVEGMGSNQILPYAELVGFYNNSVENNVIVKDVLGGKREIPVEQLWLGWLEAGWYDDGDRWVEV